MIVIKLLIDMDEVICDFLGALCSKYNKLTGASLVPEEISQYDLTQFLGKKAHSIFLKPGFFSELRAFPYAIETLKNLYSEGYHIVVATDAKGVTAVAADKKNWVERNMPFLPISNFIINSEKHLLTADLLFDDSPTVLNSFNAIKVVMDRPYNRSVDAHRIYNNDWLQFYSLVKKLEI